MRGVAAVLVLSVLANPCQAASGDLDPTFGTGGVVRTSIDGNVKFARAAVLQPDGKVVVGGLNGTSTGGSPIFVFVRYRSDGTLDPTFGVGGVVQLSRFWADSSDRASSLVLQPDGKIVAAGSTEQGDLAFALARLLPDGTLDSTFGAGGRVTTQVTLGSSSDAIDAVNLDPDGSLVAAGYASAAVGAADFALARYRTDGTLDPTFGQGGIVKTAIDFRNDSAHALVRQPDGRYVVAGHAFTGTYADFALARYEADGRLDPTFGVGGIVVTTVGPKSDFAFTLRCQPDGKLLAGGSSYVNDFNEHFVVARYASDGSLDPTFGVGGIVSLSVSATNDRVNDLLLLSDGRILAAGYSFLPAARFALMRLHVDGTLDTSFGAGGIVTTPTTGQAEALMRMPDGRIIIAGTASDNRAFVAARYDGSACGNGTIESGEECDSGDVERPGDCCLTTCRFEPAGTTCVDEGELCTLDRCDATGGCMHDVAPSPVCATPTAARGASLLLQASASGRTRARYVWGKGPAVPVEEFGDPAGGQDLRLCVYTARGAGGFALALRASPSASGGGAWTPRSTGWKFKSTTGVPDGVSGVVLRGSTLPLRARLQVQAMRDPEFPAGLPLSGSPNVIAQLKTSFGACWGATFSAPTNDTATKFRAKSD